jgi:hypothetical protein
MSVDVFRISTEATVVAQAIGEMEQKKSAGCPCGTQT